MGCRLREKHPREQGLKLFPQMPPCPLSPLREKHPREQGLKHKNQGRFERLRPLREKHPREQGLKLAIIVVVAIGGSSRKTSKRTRIETFPFSLNSMAWELREKHPREQGLKQNMVITKLSDAKTSRKTSKRTRIETRPPRGTIPLYAGNFEKNIQENKD